MTLNDWQRVKRVLEGALARSGDDRLAFVNDACGNDPALLRQVEMLLAGSERAETFLETPAVRLLDDGDTSDDLSGRVVNAYRLMSRLGAGAMGEVYLAHDDKLDRRVAIKFLSPSLAEDRDRLRRFHQEARAISSLNHPHILVVHDFGEFDGRPYMVTEYVEGETLRQRLRQGALPPRDAVEIATQIAGALAAAHTRGLVHRDIKPENLMIRPDGYVKVLDFGLAKLLSGESEDHPADVPSRTLPGMVMGTPRYMSPEQARGLDVDARSDLWSLGVLLYEMLTGRPPFEGLTSADTIAAILSVEPLPLESQFPCVAPALSAVVRKAIRKDRLERYADADEIASDLRRLSLAVTSNRDAIPTADEADHDDDAALSPAGERRRTTVLVSLVADYASLVERLAPAELDEIIGRIRAAAIDTVRRHGGVVNQSIGEEIVSLFGIPSAHEDDDLRAVRAALELHVRARDIGSTSLEAPTFPLRLQSGIHSGSVVAQRLRDGPRRYAVTGPPVQAAARLAAAADADAILLTPDCHRRVAPFVRSEPRAPVAVQSGAEPMIPHVVLGESGLDSRLDAVERGGLTPYSGRAAEFSALRREVERARQGEGRIVLLIGEAGAGKSRMMHELRAHLAESEFRILQGRCRSYGGITSYLPFVEALHGALELRDQDGDTPAVPQLVARIRSIDPSLEALIPLYLHLLSLHSDAFPLPRHLRGEHFQAAMLDALAAIFTSCANRGPVLLLLEDWHWADDASRQALRYLAEVVASCPLLIVVTTRPESATLVEAPAQSVRVNIGPLDAEASLAITRAVLATDRVPDALARRLHERTGGNPFFLEEMCQALREGSVDTGGGAGADDAADTLQLPDSVQAVIRSRVDRLDQEGREVLRVASVIGREFSRRILGEVMEEPDLTTAIDSLKSAGIIQQIRVVPDPAYRFKHVLTQEVIYESLLERQRKALHQSVGRAIQRSHRGSFDEPLELLAYHFSHAELWEEAIGYGLRAAARATELSQFADALGTLEDVMSWLLRLPDDAGRRDRVADVLLKQDRVCETLGMRGRQIQLTAELIALLAPHGASVRLAEAYLRQGDVSTLLKRFDAADRALATSLRMSRECGDAALERAALRSIGLLRWHQGRQAEALAITETALAIDRQREDDLAVAGDLANLGHILRSMGHYDRVLEVLDEALAMPVVQNDPIKRAYILHIVANAHRSLGNVGRALDILQRANESARDHMLPIQRSFHLTSIAHIHLQDGRLDESLRLYHEAVDLSRRARHADGLAQSLRMLGDVLFALGRDRESLPHLREAAQLFAQLEDREAEAPMRQHAAVVLERTGSADALGEWERLRALAQAAGDPRTELVALEGIARATRRNAPEPETAIRGFDDALALASMLGERAREATLRNTLGVLHWERGAYMEALGHYEVSLRLVRDLGDRVHEGLTLNSIGVTLSRLRRYEEARTALEEALTVNRQTGERLLEAHSLAALADVAETLGRAEAALDYYQRALSIRIALEDRRGEEWIQQQIARLRGLTADTARPESELMKE